MPAYAERAATEQIQHWVLTGHALGYPHCCIASFCTLQHLRVPRSNPWDGTGFIPCVDCAQHVERTERYIRGHRKVRSEFPWTPSQTELDRAIHDLLINL